jgi:hypothetical protein
MSPKRSIVRVDALSVTALALLPSSVKGQGEDDHDLLATTSRARSIASTRIEISRRLGSSRVKFGVGLGTTAYSRPADAPRFK